MNHTPSWSKAHISFDIIVDMTGDPVVTLAVTTPVGLLAFMGEPLVERRAMRVLATHVQGAKAGAVGWVNLRLLAEVIMEGMDLDDLVIEGAVRTTGAGAGRRPKPLRFRRNRAAGPA